MIVQLIHEQLFCSFSLVNTIFIKDHVATKYTVKHIHFRHIKHSNLDRRLRTRLYQFASQYLLVQNVCVVYTTMTIGTILRCGLFQLVYLYKTLARFISPCLLVQNVGMVYFTMLTCSKRRRGLFYHANLYTSRPGLLIQFKCRYRRSHLYNWGLQFL